MIDQIRVLENILNANDQMAVQNRALLDAGNVFSLNLMASPGAGKTSVIERTLPALCEEHRVAVIEGDIASRLDADRAEAAGATALQINTGGECHLDAIMLRAAIDQLDLNALDLLLVENVGNLICPVNFDLGTHSNVLVASVPEGDDKPYKYPGAYRCVGVLIINKIDLLPYVTFDMDRFQRGVELLNPGLETFPLSCTTGEGLDLWISWLTCKVRAFRDWRF